jgi:hypothetical protein
MYINFYQYVSAETCFYEQIFRFLPQFFKVRVFIRLTLLKNKFILFINFTQNDLTDILIKTIKETYCNHGKIISGNFCYHVPRFDL